MVLLMALLQVMAGSMSKSVLSTVGASMIIVLILCFFVNLTPLLLKMLLPLFRKMAQVCRCKKKNSNLKYMKSARVFPDCE